ncbi:DNA (cytosine-5-)-methyltransferase [Moraxella osloensis]|uniref:Cytosine-specific methyltransferase n=1 Tax=Faucicola osloensis TaxID=34062 RepID=A0A6P1KGU0_FAUOS|nr:DNA cytosine methyltransferase [Moraxella osloensis]QHG10110.1 DNA (cytosine-5-)-methyltransferase [Moraxella osloensis]
MAELNFIDLFAGAGGLSEGFVRAGFSPIAHVEIDKNACDTLQTRNAYYYLKKKNDLGIYYDYLKKSISKQELFQELSFLEQNVIHHAIGEDNSKIFNIIDEKLHNKNIDLIIGGPPCQAYSVVGRYRLLKSKDEDARNLLYKEYAKFLKKYKPKAFVFENVLGLLSAEQGKYFNNLKKYFKSIGYCLDYKVLNASDFGVLQDRKRVIIIGWRKDLDFAYPTFDFQENHNSIKDILLDLPFLNPGDSEPISFYTKENNSYLKKSFIRDENDFVTQHITRQHNERDLKIYKIAIEKWLNEKKRLNYPDLPNELKTHKNESSFIDRFKVVNVNGFSHTVLAHIAKDGHYYIYPSLEQIRSLSVREVARIQSFPDNYYFEGGRTAAFKQIGNAVPPLMAYEIAKKIKDNLL